MEIVNCVNCGCRFTCPHIKDDLIPCLFWYVGTGYGG